MKTKTIGIRSQKKRKPESVGRSHKKRCRKEPEEKAKRKRSWKKKNPETVGRSWNKTEEEEA